MKPLEILALCLFVHATPAGRSFSAQAQGTAQSQNSTPVKNPEQVATVLANQNQFLSPDDFDFLQKYLTEAVANLSSQDSTYTRRDELAAALNTARQGNFPTVGMNIEGDLSKSFQFHNAKRLNANAQALTNFSAGMTAKQNLYAGGTTGLRIDAAQFRLDAQTLSVASRTDAVRFALLKDLVSVVSLQRIFALKKSALEQANSLSEIARRKQKSGVLGVKDTVAASREALRAANDFTDAQLTLDTQIANFNTRYLLVGNVLKDTDFAALESALRTVVKKGEALLLLPDVAKMVAEKTVSLKASRIEEQAHEADLAITRMQEYNPSLDFILGVQGNVLDLSNTPAPLRPVATNQQLQPSARLSFSMSLFNPTGHAQIEEVLTRRKSILAERQSTLNTLNNKFVLAALNRTAQQSKLQGLRKITQMSLDIRQKDGRLFDAGELDIEKVIRDQQELNAENATIVDLENQINALFADLAHTGTFGFVPDNGAGR